MSFARALLVGSAFLLCTVPAFGAIDAAAGHPLVKLQLSGDLLRVAAGKVVSFPVEKATLKRGDLIRYTIAARNVGGRAALALTTVGPVPARTQFVAGSASRQSGSVLEYSLDGKSFSAQPMVAVNTAHGSIQKPANPAQYVAVRWAIARPLAPKGRLTFSYEVRVR